jgi:hypothetical protein
MAGGMAEVEIIYFSDLLCVWAYISQARIDAIKEKFGDLVLIKHRFCSVFGDTADKITGRTRGLTKDSMLICGMWRSDFPMFDYIPNSG